MEGVCTHLISGSSSNKLQLMRHTPGQGQAKPTDSPSPGGSHRGIPFSHAQPSDSPGTNLPPSRTLRRAGFPLTPAQTQGEAGKADFAAGKPRLAPCTEVAMLFAVVFRKRHFPRLQRWQRRLLYPEGGSGPSEGGGLGQGGPPSSHNLPPPPGPGRFDLMASAPSPKPGAARPCRWRLGKTSAGLGEERGQAGGGLQRSQVLALRRKGERNLPLLLPAKQSCPGAHRGWKQFIACQTPAKSFPPALPAQISVSDTCFPCTANFPRTKPFSSGRSNK